MTGTKQEILEMIGEIQAQPLSRSQRELIDDIRNRIVQDRLYVAVVGQFKRGKSTFINALLGEAVLPTGVLPLTNMITILDYGAEREFTVHFGDGTVRKEAIERLGLYVTEKCNPRNERNVAWVHVRYPSRLLAKGVTLADTPGVGSVSETQTEVTRSFLPRIDAALFMISADSPLSETELSFLRDLRGHVPNLYVLLNKVDFVGADELGELREFLENQLRQQLGAPEPPLFLVAAQPALQARLERDEDALASSGMTDIETLLSNMAERDRATIQREAHARRITGVARALRADALVESASLRQPVDVLSRQIEAFSSGVASLRNRCDEAETLLRKDLDVLVRTMENDLERIRKEFPPLIEKELRSEANMDERVGAADYAARLERHEYERLVAHFDGWFAGLEETMQRSWRVHTEEHRGRLTSLLKELLALGSSVFHTDLDEWELPEEISSEREFWYLEGKTRPFFDLEGTVFSLAGTLLPQSVSRNLALKKILSRLPQRVDANCGRIRYDMVRRLEESFQKFRRRMRDLVEETAAGIENAARSALVQRKGATEAKEQRERELKERIAACERWMNRLSGGADAGAAMKTGRSGDETYENR